MNNISLDRTHEFLNGKGFSPLKSTNSPDQFGDFFEDWRSLAFNIRIVKDRLILSLAVSAKSENHNWFELELINGLIYNSHDLTISFEFDSAILFLMSHFDQIQELFAEQNYPLTKINLEELRNVRMKQLFPNL